MNYSFYNAAVGAASQQHKLDIIANNISNVNTTGFRAKTGKFYDLLYENIREPEGNVSKVRQGSGSALLSTGISFEKSSVQQTDREYDFAIFGDGMFAVQNLSTGEVLYTRAGSFQLSQMTDGEFYLVTPSGEVVLDSTGNPILIPTEAVPDPDAAAAAQDEEARPVAAFSPDIGIFNFAHKEGFLAVGNSLFRAMPKNGEPFLEEGSQLVKGYVESSNVDIAKELTDMIATQRLYQMNLKMIQTSDEITNTINTLRR